MRDDFLLSDTHISIMPTLRWERTDRVGSTLEENALSLVVESQVEVQRHLETRLVLAAGATRFDDGAHDRLGVESRGLTVGKV